MKRLLSTMVLAAGMMVAMAQPKASHCGGCGGRRQPVGDLRNFGATAVRRLYGLVRMAGKHAPPDGGNPDPFL